MAGMILENAGVQEGDRVRVVLEGPAVKSYGGELKVGLSNGGSWWINEDHKVIILERVKPKEPTGDYIVIEGTSEWGTKFRYVKLDENKWHFVQGIAPNDTRDWAWLLDHYGNGKRITILEPGKTLA